MKKDRWDKLHDWIFDEARVDRFCWGALAAAALYAVVLTVRAIIAH